MWKETSDQHLLGQFLYSGTQRSGITNSDEVYVTKKNKNNIPGFTVQVYREKVNCVAMLLRFFFFYTYIITQFFFF